MFVWSLQWLAIGEYPDRDHHGKFFSPTYHPDRFRRAGDRLAGKNVGFFSDLTGDAKWQKEALFLEYNYSTPFMCHFCRAHKKIRRLLQSIISSCLVELCEEGLFGRTTTERFLAAHVEYKGFCNSICFGRVP